VTGHLFRIQLWSFRNRLLARLKRLRQIRYLAATLVGLGYVCFVWRPWRVVWLVGPPIRGGIPIAELALPLEAGLGALLTVIALLRWLWPGSKPVLNFNEAEVAFLFPAPLTRRQLVRYSLFRSQGGILTGVFSFCRIRFSLLAFPLTRNALRIQSRARATNRWSLAQGSARSPIRTRDLSTKTRIPGTATAGSTTVPD